MYCPSASLASLVMGIHYVHLIIDKKLPSIYCSIKLLYPGLAVALVTWTDKNLLGSLPLGLNRCNWRRSWSLLRDISSHILRTSSGHGVAGPWHRSFLEVLSDSALSEWTKRAKQSVCLPVRDRDVVGNNKPRESNRGLFRSELGYVEEKTCNGQHQPLHTATM